MRTRGFAGPAWLTDPACFRRAAVIRAEVQYLTAARCAAEPVACWSAGAAAAIMTVAQTASEPASTATRRLQRVIVISTVNGTRSQLVSAGE